MTSKKILLVITPTTGFKQEPLSLSERDTEYIPQPLGLCYLGTILRDEGYEVEIFDPHIELYDEYEKEKNAQILKNSISSKINTSHFDVLGISSPYIYTYEWAHFIAETVKRKGKTIPVVIGGGYPSLLREKVLEDRNIDYLVIGEGEIAFLKLLKYLSTHDKVDLEDIDGIGYRLGETIKMKPKKTYWENVDNIPLPSWDLVDVDKYMRFGEKKTLIVISSRGCPYSCTFCNSFQSWGRVFRKRSAANVLSEVDYLISRFGAEDILFVDDNMTVDKDRFMEIAEGMKARGVTWSTVNISSFTTDEEMLRAMKGSGCTGTAIAVESAVPKTLKALGKPVDLERTKELVRICRKIGLPLRLFYISGLPYDTKEDMLQTFQYAEEVRGDWNQFSMLVPYPGTDIFNYCQERDYFVDSELDLSKLTIRSKGFIDTEHWDREWAAALTYDYNIKTNFLRNYDLIEDDGDLDTAIRHFEYVYRFHSKHVIALICLAYAYHKKGNLEKANELLEECRGLLRQEDVVNTYGKYMEWDEEVIEFYNSRAIRESRTEIENNPENH